MIAEGTYAGRIMDWGLKFYTKNEEYKVYVKFELETNPLLKETEITWTGSLDETEKLGKNGKPYTLLGITKGKLKALGFRYASDDMESLVTKTDAFDTTKAFSIQVQAGSRDGRTFSYVQDFWEGAEKPAKESSFVREVATEEAVKILRKASKKTATTPTEPLKKAVGQSSLDHEIPF